MIAVSVAHQGAGRATEREGRPKIGCGHADLGALRLGAQLSRTNVRPAAKEISRDSHRDLSRRTRNSSPRRKQGRNSRRRNAEENPKRILALKQLGGQLWD